MKAKSVKKPFRLAAVMAAGSLALAGCAGDDAADTSDGGENRGEISIVAIPG